MPKWDFIMISLWDFIIICNFYLFLLAFNERLGKFSSPEILKNWIHALLCKLKTGWEVNHLSRCSLGPLTFWCLHTNFCILLQRAKLISGTIPWSPSYGGLWMMISTLSSVQFSSVAQSCPTLCEPMNSSMPGLPVHHQLPEFTQTHVHRVSDATLNSCA